MAASSSSAWMMAKLRSPLAPTRSWVAVLLERFRERRGRRDRIPRAHRGAAIDGTECGGGVAVHHDALAHGVGIAHLDGQRTIDVVEGVVATDLQGVDVRRDEVVLALVLRRDHPRDDVEVDADERRHGTEIDDVLEQRPVFGIRKLRQRQLRDGYADEVDVRAAQVRRHLLGVVVHQVAARHDGLDVFGEGLGVHRHHDVDAFSTTHVAVLRDPHLEPSGQPFDVRRKDVARRHRNAHAEQRLGEHAIGGGRTRTVDVGEADDEIVVGPVRRGSAGRVGAERVRCGRHRSWRIR